MKAGSLKNVTGKFVKGSVKWLEKEQMGCCSICFASDGTYNYAVCIGWHDLGDDWAIAWKIGRQATNNIMQCDFDIDFEMPFSEESGDVDDTQEVIKVVGGTPVGYHSWAGLATFMRKVARRVWKDWKVV